MVHAYKNLWDVQLHNFGDVWFRPLLTARSLIVSTCKDKMVPPKKALSVGSGRVSKERRQQFIPRTRKPIRSESILNIQKMATVSEHPKNTNLVTHCHINHSEPCSTVIMHDWPLFTKLKNKRLLVTPSTVSFELTSEFGSLISSNK